MLPLLDGCIDVLLLLLLLLLFVVVGQTCTLDFRRWVKLLPRALPGCHSLEINSVFGAGHAVEPAIRVFSVFLSVCLFVFCSRSRSWARLGVRFPVGFCARLLCLAFSWPRLRLVVRSLICPITSEFPSCVVFVDNSLANSGHSLFTMSSEPVPETTDATVIPPATNEDSAAAEESKEEQKEEEPQHKNPVVFFDIDIAGTYAGRIEITVRDLCFASCAIAAIAAPAFVMPAVARCFARFSRLCFFALHNSCSTKSPRKRRKTFSCSALTKTTSSRRRTASTVESWWDSGDPLSITPKTSFAAEAYVESPSLCL